VVSDGFDVGPERNIVGLLTEFKGVLYLTGETMEPRILLPTQPSERVPPKGFQLYKSSDGATWIQVGKDGFGADSSTWASIEVLGGSAYLGVYDYHAGDQLWRSADGKNWELIFREPHPSWFSEGGGPVEFQGHLLWLDNDLKRGVEIWRTDAQVVGEQTTTTASEGTTGSTSGEGSAVDDPGDHGRWHRLDRGSRSDGARRWRWTVRRLAGSDHRARGGGRGGSGDGRLRTGDNTEQDLRRASAIRRYPADYARILFWLRSASESRLHLLPRMRDETLGR
jgi:hypothetical protein